MIPAMKDCPVIIVSANLGSLVGVLRDHDGSTVTLDPARTVQWPREAGMTWLDVATEGPPRKPPSALSPLCRGPVTVTDCTGIAPLSEAACRAIVRQSEDNLSLTPKDPK